MIVIDVHQAFFKTQQQSIPGFKIVLDKSFVCRVRDKEAESIKIGNSKSRVVNLLGISTVKE